jgi:hypothetical protein
MSTLGVGADFKEFQQLFAPRVDELGSEFVEPLDEVSDAVTRLEHELDALRSRRLDEMTDKWDRYKSGYERYLRPEEAVVEDEESARSEDVEQTERIQSSHNSAPIETSTAEAAVSQDDEEGEDHTPDEPAGSVWGSAAERNEGAPT